MLFSRWGQKAFFISLLQKAFFGNFVNGSNARPIHFPFVDKQKLCSVLNGSWCFHRELERDLITAISSQVTFPLELQIDAQTKISTLTKVIVSHWSSGISFCKYCKIDKSPVTLQKLHQHYKYVAFFESA